jgi:hypothetical protein
MFQKENYIIKRKQKQRKSILLMMNRTGIEGEIMAQL